MGDSIGEDDAPGAGEAESVAGGTDPGATIRRLMFGDGVAVSTGRGVSVGLAVGAGVGEVAIVAASKEAYLVLSAASVIAIANKTNFFIVS